MRERWVDDGRGLLSINTNTMHISIRSRARKNYRTTLSHWTLYFWVKGQYGYMARIYDTFGGTLEEALDRAETMVKEMFESIQEII
jgi:hypothetical protein